MRLIGFGADDLVVVDDDNDELIDVSLDDEFNNIDDDDNTVVEEGFVSLDIAGEAKVSFATSVAVFAIGGIAFVTVLPILILIILELKNDYVFVFPKCVN